MEIVLTVIGTVTSGVLVFIAGQILTTIWLAPLQQYKRLKEKIVYALNYYAIMYKNVIDVADNNQKQIDEYNAASDEMRMLSCELFGFIETLSFVKIGIPPKDDLYTAANDLMVISKSFFTPYNDKSDYRNQTISNGDNAEEIKKLLKCQSKKEEKYWWNI